MLWQQIKPIARHRSCLKNFYMTLCIEKGWGKLLVDIWLLKKKKCNMISFRRWNIIGNAKNEVKSRHSTLKLLKVLSSILEIFTIPICCHTQFYLPRKISNILREWLHFKHSNNTQSNFQQITSWTKTEAKT